MLDINISLLKKKISDETSLKLPPTQQLDVDQPFFWFGPHRKTEKLLRIAIFFKYPHCGIIFSSFYKKKALFANHSSLEVGKFMMTRAGTVCSNGTTSAAIG